MRAAHLLPVILLAAVSAASGQGPLTPPGAPAPTMKTLDQVEARTPLSGGTSTITVSADGSYYLTGDIVVPTGNGIDITADNVTLDLNGYTVRSTGATPGGVGINCASLGSATIRNGRVRSGTTLLTNTFSPAGFVSGIVTSSPSVANVRVENVEVSGIAGTGIMLSDGATAVIARCQVSIVSGAGISCGTATVTGCVVNRCNNTAITGNVVADCVGISLNGAGITGGLAVSNSRGETSNLGNGASTPGVFGQTVTNCYGITTSTSATAAGVAGIVVRGCYGKNNNAGRGIFGTNVSDSNGSSTQGTGIAAVTASNCSGTTSSKTAPAAGIDCGPNGTALNCYASAGGGTASSLVAKIANGCSLDTGSQAGIAHNVNSF